MDRKETILAQIKAAVLSVDASAEVILFGSQARGDTHEESDWDVLVLTGNSAVGREFKQRFLNQILHVELNNSITIGCIIRTKEEWADLALTWLYKEVKKDGKQLV